MTDATGQPAAEPRMTGKEAGERVEAVSAEIEARCSKSTLVAFLASRTVWNAFMLCDGRKDAVEAMIADELAELKKWGEIGVMANLTKRLQRLSQRIDEMLDARREGRPLQKPKKARRRRRIV